MFPDPTISACLVVYHEEDLIERCLGSFADVVDEIIVLHDGPCSDRTLELAQRYGARTAEMPRVGHAERHTVTAYEWARSEWILTVDADEFLSDGMREHLRELSRDPNVNGYSFLWRLWDGKRYITENGPFRVALFRKRAVHLVGHIHAVEDVDPPVVQTEYALEHQPRYNNFALSSVATKWRRWARINADEWLMPLEELPTFNVTRPRRWTWRRKVLNILSPILLVPYFGVTFAVEYHRTRGIYGARERLRHASYMAIYATMVQVYIAKRLYFDRLFAPRR